MPTPAPPIPTELAQRWLNLAQRRADYFTELFHSGRWKHYYDERQFIERMGDVMNAVEDWRILAGQDDQVTAP